MTVYQKSRPESIQKMFDAIAKNYDRTNAVLSFCMHHYWNDALVKHAVLPCRPKSLVDLCAGTGEIAFRSIHSVPSLDSIQLVDFSAEMLECAKNKAEKKGRAFASISYIQADVQSLPLADNSIDCMTMAYGIRNVYDRKKCFGEVFRTLESNGVFGILELTEPTNRLLRTLHKGYLKTALPLLGKLFTSDQEAYSYLCNSIHAFVKPAELQSELRASGFSAIQALPLTGGIATLFIARKSSSTSK